MRLFEAVSDVAASLELFFRNARDSAKEQQDQNPGAEIDLNIPYDDPNLSMFLHSKGIGQLSQDALQSLMKDPDNEKILKDLIIIGPEGVEINLGQDKQATLTPNSSAGKSVDQMAHNVVAKNK